MELGFPRRTVQDILAVKADWPDDIALIQKGRTASLAIHVAPIDMKLSFAAQLQTHRLQSERVKAPDL